MQISNSGRVIIIDDKLKEALPLIEVLGKNNIPHMYFDGTLNSLPDEPIKGVRFVFLDIELKGMEGHSEKTKASGLMSLLEQLISTENGPYVIIFWTQHPQVIKLVLKNYEKSNIKPVAHLDLDKSKFKNADGSFDLIKIIKFLEIELVKIGAFQLYVNWENIVNLSTKDFVYEFSSLAEQGPKWSKDTQKIFYSLYKAVVERNETKDDNAKFIYASQLMNRSFGDILETNTITNLLLPEGFNFKNGGVDKNVKAKLNTALFLSTFEQQETVPGCITLTKSDKLLKSLEKTVFMEGKSPPINYLKLCRANITPLCDVAQNNLIDFNHGKTDDKDNIYRYVYGVFYRKNENVEYNTKGQDSRFKIGPFWYKNDIWYFQFHFSTVAYKPHSVLRGNFLFMLKRDLLFDLQSKAANHINRLGNMVMK